MMILNWKKTLCIQRYFSVVSCESGVMTAGIIHISLAADDDGCLYVSRTKSTDKSTTVIILTLKT